MKTKLLFFLLSSCLIFSVVAQKSSSDFVFTIKTDNHGLSSPSSFQLNLDSNARVDIDFDNDGVFDVDSVSGTTIHTYGVPGIHTIRLRGLFPKLKFRVDAMKLVSIDQWGSQVWTSCDSMFYGCSNLLTIPLDTPNLENVNSLKNMFGACSNFNGPVNHWDVSNVSNLSSMFKGATNFNFPLNGWDVSAVIDFSGIFFNASRFNLPLNNWVLSSATNISYMFNGADSFNQPLSSWDVSSVIDMTYMFGNAISFNQPLDSWDVSSVVDMFGMFSNATSFNQLLTNWSTLSVRDMDYMFDRALNFNQELHHWNYTSINSMHNFLDSSALSVNNYDSLIFHFEKNYPNKNLAIGALGLKYCKADSVRTLLINSGWAFHRDSIEQTCKTVGLEKRVNFKGGFTIYPNPTRGTLEINILNAEVNSLRVFNSKGQLIKEQTFSKSTSRINVSNFSNGVYFLQVGNRSERFVVKH